MRFKRHCGRHVESLFFSVQRRKTFLFTVVHQQGELMKSQRAVGRHTEEGEELTGAWKTKGDTGGAGDPGMHLHKRMMK